MFTPHDDGGRTAWDYAGGMWRELCAIRAALTESGPQSDIRWLNLIGDPYAGGGLTSQGALRVPVGCRWTALAVSGSSGSNGADVVELYRNVVGDSGFITRLVAAGGRFSMVNLPDNLVLQENTLLIARVTILAAADGLFPTVNLATREVHYGRPPEQTQEQGESLASYPDDITDTFPDRIAEVEYQEARR